MLELLSAVGLALGTAYSTADNVPGSYVLQFENDIFFDTDQHYTNGMRVGYQLPWLFLEEKLADAPLIFNYEAAITTVFGLGHTMYTPEDLSVAEVQLDDRPYGAWLFGYLGVTQASQTWIQHLELAAGITGPDAQGEAIQTWVHEEIGATIPRGWEHQVKERFGLQLTYTIKRLSEQVGLFGGLEVDLAYHAGLSAGTLFNFAELGGELRLGFNLPFWTTVSSSATIAGSLHPALVLDEAEAAREQAPGWSLFLVTGARGRGIVNNYFIEGETASGDRFDLDPRHLGADYFLGVSWMGGDVLARSWTISFLGVGRTSEVKTIEDAHYFGAITVRIDKRF